MQALADFNWGLSFGFLKKEYEFVFKYGNPWLYPALEFEELKTLTLAFMTSKVLVKSGQLGPKVDVIDALDIPPHIQEENKKRTRNMTAYFRNLDN